MADLTLLPRMVWRNSAEGARGQASHLPLHLAGARGAPLGMKRLMLDVEAALPFPVSHQVPVPNHLSSPSPNKCSPQQPTTAGPHRAPSTPSITILHVKASNLIPEFVDKTMNYRPAALKQSYGERLICDRVRTSKETALVHVYMCACVWACACVCSCVCYRARNLPAPNTIQVLTISDYTTQGTRLAFLAFQREREKNHWYWVQ